MKKFLYITILLISTKVWSQTDLKIGTSPGIKDATAVLDLSSTTKGLLIPRLTTAQMNSISSPTLGLMIYNTDLNCLHFYFSGWKSQCDPTNLNAWSILGNSNTSSSTNFLGTTNAQDLVFKTNNSERLRILSGGNVGINTSAPNATLDVSGSYALAITTTTTNLTLDATHHTVIITGGNPTITFPAASTCARRIYTIVNQTGGNRNVSSYISFTGSNATSVVKQSGITVQSDGTNWYQIQ